VNRAEHAVKIRSIPASVHIARQERITGVIWAGFSLAAVALLLYGPTRHPVNESYANGARSWESGTPLYTDGGCGFIYPPQAAILHWPFLQLPHALYEFAWRIVNLGLFAAGVYRLATCCETVPRPRSSVNATDGAAEFAGAPPTDALPKAAAASTKVAVPLSLFLLMTLLTLPKTWTLALNGQATTAMTGLMLLAVVDVAERRWWRAAVALLLALAFKPLAIVLLLLLSALFPPLLWRVSAGGLVFLAIPYLTRNAAYVTEQYAAFVRNLDAVTAIGQDMVWPNLFSTLHMFGIDVSLAAQTGLQIVAALLTLGAGWLVCRRFPAPQAAVLLYSLAATYLLLLNARTENNSYTLLMPAVATFTIRALVVEKRFPRLLLLIAIVAALTGGFEITRVITPRAAIVWPCPVACLVFLGFIVNEIAKPVPWTRFQPARRAPLLIPASGFKCPT
jgi:hypothetical protein